MGNVKRDGSGSDAGEGEDGKLVVSELAGAWSCWGWCDLVGDGSEVYNGAVGLVGFDAALSVMYLATFLSGSAGSI